MSSSNILQGALVKHYIIITSLGQGSNAEVYMAYDLKSNSFVSIKCQFYLNPFKSLVKSCVTSCSNSTTNSTIYNTTLINSFQSTSLNALKSKINKTTTSDNKYTIMIKNRILQSNPNASSIDIPLDEFNDFITLNHTVHVYQFTVHNLYLMTIEDLMELCHITSLEASFSILTIKSITRQLLQAIDIIHSIGVIHTDIKPGNIMLEDTCYYYEYIKLLFYTSGILDDVVKCSSVTRSDVEPIIRSKITNINSIISSKLTMSPIQPIDPIKLKTDSTFKAIFGPDTAACIDTYDYDQYDAVIAKIPTWTNDCYYSKMLKYMSSIEYHNKIILAFDKKPKVANSKSNKRKKNKGRKHRDLSTQNSSSQSLSQGSSSQGSLSQPSSSQGSLSRPSQHRRQSINDSKYNTAHISKQLQSNYNLHKIYKKPLKQYTKPITKPAIRIVDISSKINNKLKLIDFGNSQPITKTTNHELQPVVYRAPEIILNILDYNQSIDTWSVGMILFELVYGLSIIDLIPSRILNDPAINRDIHLLYIMTRVIGDIPHELANQSQRKSYLFDSNNKLLFTDTTANTHLTDISIDNLLMPLTRFNSSFSERELRSACDLMRKMLCYDYKNRSSAKVLLEHEFLADVVQEEKQN